MHAVEVDPCDAMPCRAGGRILGVVAVRVAVCGPLTVQRHGESLRGPALGTRKSRLLIAVLVAAHRSAVPTDRLIEALWPQRAPRDPEGNLATLVSRLRSTVGAPFVVPGAGSYALARDTEIDVEIAAELLTTAAARLARGEATLAVASASRALDLLGEDAALAEEFDPDPAAAGDWATGLRRETAEARRQARHLLSAAAFGADQPDLASAAALAATAADPYDERAHRDLMAALARDGRPSAALSVYAELAGRLADELGTDPDAETQALQLAILRSEPAIAGSTTPPAPEPAFALVGRDAELARLDRAWADASAGRAGLLLVAGVPGVGKTRLLAEVADLARASGGMVLTVRCRPQERSLFLQPFVEVLRPVLLSLPRSTLELLLGGHLPAWARMLPELRELFEVTEPPAAELVDGTEAPATAPELARRQAFDAILASIGGLAARRPVLLAIDDLQYGARATATLVGQLADALPGAPLLTVAATRTDGLPALRQLTATAAPMMLGPLSRSAVHILAGAAGLGARSAEVHDRTRGHPLSVIASLHALASGTPGPAADIATTVAAELDRLDPETAGLARAASVLGTSVEPPVLAGLADLSEVTAVLGCEQLVTAGLMVTAGVRYEFTNDLVADAVRATLPAPLAVAYHRRAADLLADRPERMAAHAHESGEFARACGGYLEAGRASRLTGALDDALALLDLAVADARAAGDEALVASALLERARAHEAGTDFDAAEVDVVDAEASVASTGDRRLRMRAQYIRGGDISIARGRPVEDVVRINWAGHALAAELGDPVTEALFRTRIVVLESSRLHLADALDTATAGLTQARTAGVGEAITRSLDGLKSALSHVGDAAALAPVLDELIPMLVERRLNWLLQWALLESALVPAASDDWQQARRRVDEAIEVNRRTGYTAYTGFFLAQRAYLARLAGDLDAALDDGREAVACTSPTAHPWWYAAAAGVHASTLLHLGRRDDVAALCTTSLANLGDQVGAGYRLRCLAPLAAVTGDYLDEVDRLVSTIQTPPGRAWLAGADVYDALATAWLAAGRPDRAATSVRPLLAATASSWPAVHRRLRHRVSATSAAARSAPSPGTGR